MNLYEQAKHSRDNHRKLGLVFESALLTQHLGDLAELMTAYDEWLD